MVVNACVSPQLTGHHDHLDFNGVGFQRTRSNGRKTGAVVSPSGTNKVGIDLRSRSTGRSTSRYGHDRFSKESLLYNNRNKRLEGVRQTQEFIAWQEQQKQQQNILNSRSRSVGRAKIDSNIKINDRLKNFGGIKTPNTSRTTAMARPRSTTPTRVTQGRNGSRSPSSSNRRQRSFDLKKRVAESANRPTTPTSFADRVKMAMSPRRQQRDDADDSLQIDVTTLAMPTVDITSRYGDRPIFESSRLKAPFMDRAEEKNDMPIFNPVARTTTLFEHTKKKEAAKASQRRKEQQENADWRPQTNPIVEKATRKTPKAGGKKSSMDPVEQFRDAYKEEDKEEPITQVEVQPNEISKMLSDLSVSTLGNTSHTIQSPRTPGAPRALQSTRARSFPNTTRLAANKTPRNKGPLKSLAVDFQDTTLDDMPKIKSNGYSGPDSPMSQGDGDDRYTMLSDNNDAFDAAARHRLNASAPRSSVTFSGAVLRNTPAAITPRPPSSLSTNSPDTVSGETKTSLLFGGNRKNSKRRPRTPTNRETAANTIIHSANKVNINLDNHGGDRGKTGRLLPRRRPTPGLALGQSRSFVDQVEDKLAELKNKRELQGYQEQLFAAKNALAIAPTGDRGQKSATEYKLGKSTMSTVKKGKKSAVKGLQKAGACFVDALTGGRDKPLVPMQLDLVAHTASTNGLTMDKMSMREQNKGYATPKSSGLTKQQQQVASNGAFEMHNRDSVSSGSGRMRMSLLFGRRRQAERVKGHYQNKGDGKGGDSHTSSGGSLPSVIHTTTFDSAVKPENREEEAPPPAEFAVVELGEDEDTIQTHTILMNKNDLEVQLTSPGDQQPMSQENIPLVANMPKLGLHSIAEGRPKKKSKEPSPLMAPPKTKQVTDDASIDNLKLTVSFAEQLRQIQELQKPPYKVPRGAYLL